VDDLERLQLRDDDQFHLSRVLRVRLGESCERVGRKWKMATHPRYAATKDRLELEPDGRLRWNRHLQYRIGVDLRC